MRREKTREKGKKRHKERKKEKWMGDGIKGGKYKNRLKRT